MLKENELIGAIGIYRQSSRRSRHGSVPGTVAGRLWKVRRAVRPPVATASVQRYSSAATASVNCTQAATASVNCTQAAMASVNCTQAATGSVQLYSSAATASVQLYSSAA